MSVELSDIAVKDILEKVNEALAPSNSEAEAEGEQTEDPIEAVRVSSVLETILDQIGIEGKLPSGSPYVSIKNKSGQKYLQ